MERENCEGAAPQLLDVVILSVFFLLFKFHALIPYCRLLYGDKHVNRFLGLMALIAFCIAIYFGIRAWMSLLFIIPICLLFVAGIEKIGVYQCAIGIIITSVLSVVIVNSITPIFGERYEARLHREMIYEDAKKEEDEKTRKIVIARTAIRNMLKDPSSATFYSELIKNNGTVCGYVNAKNSFGAYSGNERYLYLNGNAHMNSNTGEFNSLWVKYCSM
ncbi:hypothetical protein ACS0TO_04380 [Serratia marcescens]|uniref:hypothetical protein n=1 Tax=Serratia marcescens TaxID=615 RepID=UPI003EC6C989